MHCGPYPSMHCTGGCVCQHALGRGCVSQHVLCRGSVFYRMHCTGGVCIPACTGQGVCIQNALGRGCVSQHALGRGCLPGGVCPGGCLPAAWGWCLPRGCLPGGVCPGGFAWGVSAQGDVADTPPGPEADPSLWIEWKTGATSLRAYTLNFFDYVVCPSGWTVVGNKCYYFHDERKNLTEAEAACKAKDPRSR